MPRKRKIQRSDREFMSELGFDKVKSLDEETCWLRVRRLERGLRHGYWDDDEELKARAKAYVRWYRWAANKMASGEPYRKKAEG